MALGVAPHEDPLVGLGLAAFGAALVATAGRLPGLPGLPKWVPAVLGNAIVLTTAAAVAHAGLAFDVRKVAVLSLGLATAACAPVLHRHVSLSAGRSLPVAWLVLAALAAMGMPLAVWALQAASADAIGSTPVELFVRFALIAPLAALLAMLGLDPHVAGQTLTYATPHGPLALEIGAACSGLQAMAMFTGVLAMFLWFERPAGRRLAVWSAIGIAGVYGANLVRLAVLTGVGYGWGVEALLRVHAQAGWAFFVAWALAFSWLVRLRRRRASWTA